MVTEALLEEKERISRAGTGPGHGGGVPTAGDARGWTVTDGACGEAIKSRRFQKSTAAQACLVIRCFQQNPLHKILITVSET